MIEQRALASARRAWARSTTPQNTPITSSLRMSVQPPTSTSSTRQSPIFGRVPIPHPVHHGSPHCATNIYHLLAHRRRGFAVPLHLHQTWKDKSRRACSLARAGHAAARSEYWLVLPTVDRRGESPARRITLPVGCFACTTATSRPSSARTSRGM